MPAQPLTPERVLRATEEVLRRYGPAKATVVDVARALGVSHGSVYQHFGTKAALRDAVTRRWLTRAHADLLPIAEEDGPAPDRLGRWLDALFAAKRGKADSDPQLFATYRVLAAEHSAAVADHVAELVGQITRVLTDGLRRGEFVLPAGTPDPAPAARAVWDATTRFHDPAYAEEWSRGGADAAYAAVRALVLRSLTP